MKRVLILIAAVLVVVGAAAAGWVAASTIKSPEQVASEAEPPEPSLITVPVERLVISADVVTRGDVRFDQPQSVLARGVALEGLAPVITWVPEAGSEFGEGTVLYEVSGRPVFALQGDLPLFRDLGRGAEGEDVALFQTALARLGFDPGQIDGVYGPITESAAAELYTAAGYEILGPIAQDEEMLEAAQNAADDARRIYTDSRKASDEATAAEAVATNAKAACDKAGVDLSAAESDLEVALDSGLPDDDPEVVALVAAVAGAQAALDTATADLADARAKAEGARAMADGFDLAGSWEVYARARDDLEEIKGRVGQRVPMSEIVFFDLFPLRVDTVNLQRGDDAAGEVMRVSGSRLAVDSSVPINDAEFVEVGDPVLIDLRSRGIEVTGKITIKADRPGTNDVGAQRVYLEIVPDEIRADLNEANVRITIPVETTGGEVLAVPAAAISATADGSSQVRIQHDDGSTSFVTVIPGLSSSGLVQITAGDGELSEGDRVVVGTS
jgi:hypothetical protein